MAANHALVNERTVFTGVERPRRTEGKALIGAKLTCLSKMTKVINVNRRMMSKRSAFMSDMNGFISDNRVVISGMNEFIRMNHAWMNEMNAFINDN